MKALKGKLLFVMLFMVIVIAGVGGVCFLQPQLLPFGLAQASGPEPTPESRQAGSGPMYTMKERILNLKAGDSMRYLKVMIAIEFDSHENFANLRGEEYKKKQEEFNLTIAPKLPLLNDAITTIITTKDASELSTLEGKERLREELKEKFNTLLGEPKVVRVYFTEFVMQ